MSKASLRASIEVKKAEIARIRTDIATERSRKSQSTASYAAKIKAATTKSQKDSYRRQKASVIGYHESRIRGYQTRIAQFQREIVSLRERMKYEK